MATIFTCEKIFLTMALVKGSHFISVASDEQARVNRDGGRSLYRDYDRLAGC